MVTQHNKSLWCQAGVLFCLLVCCTGFVKADEFYADGQIEDIDRIVDGWLAVADATVNLYENAWIKDYYNERGQLVSVGEIWAYSGAVLNIFGGQVDYKLFISSLNNGSPEAEVTFYGTDFTVDDVPVEPGTPELYLNNKVLGGVYESGTEFAISVVCFSEGDFYMTVKLGWIESAPEIEVSSDRVEFGEVEVGQTGSVFVTIANNGSGNLSLQALEIEQSEDSDFDFMPLAQLPVTMEPNEIIDVELVFAPLAEGPYEGYLLIYSDDPEFPLVEVLLTGTGIITEEVELTAKEKIAAICDFYRAGIQDGTIVGTGPGNSGKARAAVIEMSLTTAQNLINGGYERFALVALKSVAAKTAGWGWPWDFVAGPAVPELNTMIRDLIEDIRGDYPRKIMYHHWFQWKKHPAPFAFWNKKPAFCRWW